MTPHPLVARRRAERSERIDSARSWAARLAGRVPVEAVVVIGSVARGDFNRWSDLDVLVVADRLPPDPRARLELLAHGAPPGLQPVGCTTHELTERRRRRDPMVEEAYRMGVTVWGCLPAGPGQEVVTGPRSPIDVAHNARAFADVLSLVDAIPFGQMHASSGRVRPDPPRWADLVRASPPEG